MQNLKDSPGVGLVLLSADFKVIGMNEFAGRILGPAVQKPGTSVLQCHPFNIHPDIRDILRVPPSHPDAPATMVVDIRDRAVTINVSEVTLKNPGKSILVMTFIDITGQIDAEVSSHAGPPELRKLPIRSKGALHLVDMESIYFIQADASCCRIFTGNGSFYIQSSLRSILRRCSGLKFFRVHRSFVVNIEHVQRVERDSRDRTVIVFDRDTVPSIPIARQRLHELKSFLGCIG